MKAARLLLLGGLGLVLAVVLLEWTLDALDPMQVGRLADFRALRRASVHGAAGWRLRPGVELGLGEGSFVVTSGEDGLRGPPLGESAALRVVAIGDGAVFGWGVDEELCAVRRLATRLEGRAGAPPVEVVNVGHPFHTAADLPGALRAARRQFDADLVLVFGRAAGFDLTAELRAIRDAADPFHHGLAGLLPTTYDLASGAALHGRAGEDPAGIAPLATVLDALSAARDAGSRVAFVSLGARPWSDVAARCAARGLPAIRADAEAEDRSAPVFLDVRNRLPNAYGHARIAAALAAAIEFAGDAGGGGALRVRSTAR